MTLDQNTQGSLQRPPRGRHVIVVGHGYHDYAVEVEILRPYGVEQIHAVDPADAAFGEHLARAEAILVRDTPITAAHLAVAPKLRIIARYGIGLDNIDLAAATAHRIFVANTPGYGVDEVSTHALALLLAVARRVVSRDNVVRRGAWGIAQAEPIYAISGRTLGVVGYGQIARAFARKMQAFSPQRTLVYDPYLSDTPAEIERVDLATLCREADLISLHAPLTPETRHLIGPNELALMQPRTILVNTGRGALIDEAALVEALRAGRLYGAGIDVFAVEPPPPDHPLFSLPNVVVTDHTAWYSEASVRELQERASQEIARVLAGGVPQAWVNRWE